MSEVLERLHKLGIIPVVVIDHKEDAQPLASALCQGGLACAEVTFRTDQAADAIRIMTEKFPEMLVGAGTVLNISQVDQAVDAGARFIVSPGLNPEVVRYCQKIHVPITPGIATATEIEQAIGLGLDVVKFFPAEPSGGLRTIKALAAPYTGISFMPTGGIHEENVRDYLAYDRIFACGGSWMVKKEWIAAGRFDQIERMTQSAAAIVREMRGAA